MYDVSPMYLIQNKEQVMVYSYCSTSGFILQASFIVTCSSWYTKRCQTLIEKELGSAIMHDHPKRTRDFLVFLSFFIMVLPSNLELERAIYWFNIQHRKNYGADTVSSYAMSSCHLELNLCSCVAGTSLYWIHREQQSNQQRPIDSNSLLPSRTFYKSLNFHHAS